MSALSDLQQLGASHPPRWPQVARPKRKAQPSRRLARLRAISGMTPRIAVSGAPFANAI